MCASPGPPDRMTPGTIGRQQSLTAALDRGLILCRRCADGDEHEHDGGDWQVDFAAHMISSPWRPCRWKTVANAVDQSVSQQGLLHDRNTGPGRALAQRRDWMACDQDGGHRDLTIAKLRNHVKPVLLWGA
jgi:hypothetical protein